MVGRVVVLYLAVVRVGLGPEFSGSGSIRSWKIDRGPTLGYIAALCDVWLDAMLPMSYFVLQPCDVIERVMTSTITLLPSSLHAVTSFGSLPAVISPYISDTYSSFGGIPDESVPSCGTGTRRGDQTLNNSVPANECRLLRSADQLTWSNAEATPPCDDVIGYRPLTSNADSVILDEDRTSGNGYDDRANCRDVTSGCVSEEGQDGGRHRRQLYPLYCAVCRVRLNSGEQARQHFEGRTHARRVRLTTSASCFTDSTDQVSQLLLLWSLSFWYITPRGLFVISP